MTRALLVIGFCAALAGCDVRLPGKPVEAVDKWKAPAEIVDFKTLYAENCLGCHGDGHSISGAISLNNPTYLSVVPKETLTKIITNGVPNTKMPPFAVENGGMLTDKQIGILVDGILAQGKPAAPGSNVPPYAAAPGNAANGETLYKSYVEAIEKVKGGKKMVGDDFMVNPAFLGLVSDQYLRTLVLAGRPELGIADYQNVIPGRPLSNEDISDIVAWLIAQRKNEFGEPLPPGQR